MMVVKMIMVKRWLSSVLSLVSIWFCFWQCRFRCCLLLVSCFKKVVIWIGILVVVLVVCKSLSVCFLVKCLGLKCFLKYCLVKGWVMFIKEIDGLSLVIVFFRVLKVCSSIVIFGLIWRWFLWQRLVILKIIWEKL